MSDDALSAARQVLTDPFVVMLIEHVGDPQVVHQRDAALQALSVASIGDPMRAAHARTAARTELLTPRGARADDRSPVEANLRADEVISRAALVLVFERAATLLSHPPGDREAVDGEGDEVQRTGRNRSLER